MASEAVAIPVRVGVYARISSDREGDQLGVRRQIADCERLARERGFLVADHYVDDDVSAWSGRPRPQFERLLDDVRSGAIRGVLVWHIDRLTRGDLRVLESFIDLCNEMNVELGCVTGEVDLGTHVGRLTARMLGSLARYESDHKSERILRKHEELALRGKVSGGGSRPYGYEPDKRTLRPVEAAIIRECARRFLAGESLRSIALDLNRREIPTAAGAQWQPQTLRRMLASGRISGQRDHHRATVAAAEWPAIITPAETTQIRSRLNAPDRRMPSVRRYPLSGILTCSHCGEKLVARPRAGGERRYACARGIGFSGCGKTYVKAEPVETIVTEAVLHRLDGPEVAQARESRPGDPELQRWYDQLDQDKTQLEELADLWGRRELSMDEWRAAKTPIEQRMSAARKQLSRATRSNAIDQYVGKGEQLRGEWSNLDLNQQRAIIAAVVDHVEIGPGRPGYNRFDESRLRPVWRP